MTKRAYILLSLEQPKGVTKTDLLNYVRDACSSWCGSFKPPGVDDEDPDGDPLWGIGDTVKCRNVSNHSSWLRRL